MKIDIPFVVHFCDIFMFRAAFFMFSAISCVNTVYFFPVILPLFPPFVSLCTFERKHKVYIRVSPTPCGCFPYIRQQLCSGAYLLFYAHQQPFISFFTIFISYSNAKAYCPKPDIAARATLRYAQVYTHTYTYKYMHMHR